jgi:hypothetical protein
VSIIQEALKKAQGDYSVKREPKKEMPSVQSETGRSEAATAQVEMKAMPRHHPERSGPSMRLPALVSVLTVLLLIYGLKLSLQYTGTHNNRVIGTKKAQPVVADKSASSSISAIMENPNKINPINFLEPRKSLFMLSGIMYVAGRPQAIINGQVLEEGDKISGATVLAIEKDCVLLDLNDANMRLEISK